MKKFFVFTFLLVSILLFGCLKNVDKTKENNQTTSLT